MAYCTECGREFSGFRYSADPKHENNNLCMKCLFEYEGITPDLMTKAFYEEPEEDEVIDFLYGK